jgi:hypothetical protein
MKQLFARFDIDFDQWLALTKTALRVDMRSSSFMRARLGAQARAASALIGQLIFYTLLGGATSLLVWFSPDVFLSATAVLTYVMFMVGTAALVDHNAAIVSPEDHQILGFRPINSRTYFAARLANVLVYTLVITTLFTYLPIGSYFLRWGPAIGFASIAAVYGASLTIALTMVVVYASLLRTVGPMRLKRVLSYVQLLLSFVVYGGYFVMSQLVSKNAIAHFTLPKTSLILLWPPTWFASYLEMAAGRVSQMEYIPVAASVVLLVALTAALSGRLSLDYAERIGAISTDTRTVSAPPAKKRRAWMFRAGEARAVALLIRSQFKNDMKFRMGVLAILPLTIIYLMMGINEQGTVGDAFVPGKSAEGLRMVTIAMLMFPTMLKLNFSRSDAFRASWIFFACPIDRTRMVRAAKNVLVVAFLVPYILFVGVILSFYTANVWHLAIHLTVVGLISHLALQMITFMDPALPFSKPAQKGRSTGRIMMVMMTIGVASVVIPVAAPLVYRSAVATTILIATLVGLSVLAERMTRLRVEANASQLEFEG